MCRFSLYIGRPVSLDCIVTRPKRSIINQSFDAALDSPINGDGFGVAWYNYQISKQAGLFRDISPAWNNLNLQRVSQHVVGHCILAHVRAASPGLPVVQTNCHPFVMDEYTMMHNGHIGDFVKVRRPLLERLSDDIYSHIEGTTDSEHLFGLIMQEMKSTRSSDPLERMKDAVFGGFKNLAELATRYDGESYSALNIAFTDGLHVVATRQITHGRQDARSLYYHVGEELIVSDKEMQFSKPGTPGEEVLISSEPLNDDPNWRQVPVNSMLTVDADRKVEIMPFPPFFSQDWISLYIGKSEKAIPDGHRLWLSLVLRLLICFWGRTLPPLFWGKMNQSGK